MPYFGQGLPSTDRALRSVLGSLGRHMQRKSGVGQDTARARNCIRAGTARAVVLYRAGAEYYVYSVLLQHMGTPRMPVRGVPRCTCGLMSQKIYGFVLCPKKFPGLVSRLKDTFTGALVKITRDKVGRSPAVRVTCSRWPLPIVI